MAESVRTAGTLVGAVLESAGYHYQAAILDALANPFANEVGGFIYLVGIVVAVTFVATQGSYRLGAWLLIGPPLFFSVIQVRGTIPNARWEFGRQQRPNQVVQEEVRRLAPFVGEANVSKLFARYVELISVSINEIVARIDDGRKNTDIWFLMKGELFSLLHTTRIQDVGLQRLIHHALYLECGDLIRWGRQAQDPLLRQFSPGDLEALNLAGPEAAQDREYFRPTQQYALQKYNEEYNARRVNLHEEAARFIAAQRLGPGADNEAIRQEAQRVQREVKSCREVWGFVIAGILQVATNQHQRIQTTAQNWGIPQAVINNLLLQAHGVQSDQPLVFDQSGGEISPEQTQQIVRIIARFLLRNEDGDPDRGSWIAYMANRHEHRVMSTRLQGHNSFSEQSRVTIREWAEKERLIHAASSLPYTQGLALFFLGTFFPFFALLLLVPGKQAGFMLWFTLWLWVKSWDVGLAIVMLLDDTFFSLFAVEHQAIGRVQELSSEAQAELGVAMQALREMDPTFRLGTYYTLIAVCVLAVPPTMAQLILGTLRTGATLISAGTNQFSGLFSNAAYAHQQRVLMSSLRSDYSALMQERAKSYANSVRAGMQLSQNAEAAAAKAGGGGGAGGAGGKGGLPDLNFNKMLEGISTPNLGGAKGREAKGRQLAKEAAFRNAWGEPLGSPTGLRKPSVADNVLRVLMAAQGRFDKQALYEMNPAHSKAEREFIARVAVWQTATSARAIELHERMAMHGIPIPWSSGVGDPNEAAVAMALARYEERQRLKKAEIQMWQEITSASIDSINRLFPGTNAKTADDLKKAFDKDPSKRAAVLAETSKLLKSKSSGPFKLEVAGVGFEAVMQTYFNNMGRAQDQWRGNPIHGEMAIREDMAPHPFTGPQYMFKRPELIQNATPPPVVDPKAPPP